MVAGSWKSWSQRNTISRSALLVPTRLDETETGYTWFQMIPRCFWATCPTSRPAAVGHARSSSESCCCGYSFLPHWGGESSKRLSCEPVVSSRLRGVVAFGMPVCGEAVCPFTSISLLQPSKVTSSFFRSRFSQQPCGLLLPQPAAFTTTTPTSPLCLLLLRCCCCCCLRWSLMRAISARARDCRACD